MQSTALTYYVKLQFNIILILTSVYMKLSPHFRFLDEMLTQEKKRYPTSFL